MDKCIKCDTYNKCLESAIDLKLEHKKSDVACNFFSSFKDEVGRAINVLSKIDFGYEIDNETKKQIIYHLNKM